MSCSGSGSSSSAGNTALNVIMFQSTTPPPADRLPKDDPDEQQICPDVIISDGGAAIRAQAGQDSSGLRYQISITNVARECTATGNGTFRLKVGV